MQNYPINMFSEICNRNCFAGIFWHVGTMVFIPEGAVDAFFFGKNTDGRVLEVIFGECMYLYDDAVTAGVTDVRSYRN